MKRTVLLFMLLYGLLAGVSFGQNAAVQKVASKYTSGQLTDLQTNTPYKYQGMVLFYAESWLVDEQGTLRLPTESEILAVDIDHYTIARQADQRVTVYDNTSGLNLVLLGRNEFEQLYMGRLNPTDLQAYQAYKARFENLDIKASK